VLTGGGGLFSYAYLSWVYSQCTGLINAHFFPSGLLSAQGTVGVSILIKYYRFPGCFQIIIDTGHVDSVSRCVSPVQVLVDPVIG